MVGELLELFRNSRLIEGLQIHADLVLDASEENSAFPDRLQPVDLPCLRNIHLSWATPRSQYNLPANIQHPPNRCVSTQARSDGDIAQPRQNVFPKSWGTFSLPDLTCVTLRMKRERLSTECAVIVKKSNGASVSISHLHDVDSFILVDGDGNVTREPSRSRDDSHVLSDTIGLVRSFPFIGFGSSCWKTLEPTRCRCQSRSKSPGPRQVNLFGHAKPDYPVTSPGCA